MSKEAEKLTKVRLDETNPDDQKVAEENAGIAKLNNEIMDLLYNNEYAMKLFREGRGLCVFSTLNVEKEPQTSIICSMEPTDTPDEIMSLAVHTGEAFLGDAGFIDDGIREAALAEQE